MQQRLALSLIIAAGLGLAGCVSTTAPSSPAATEPVLADTSIEPEPSEADTFVETQPSRAPISASSVKTLYFGNVPWSVTPEDLANLVSQYCDVIIARIATDRETGRSRGFGYVMVPGDKADAVIDALNGMEWGGRALTVTGKPSADGRRELQR